MRQGEALPAFEAALPDSGDTPAEFSEGCLVPPVTFNVAANLRAPELIPVGGPPEKGAVMAVPKAAMHEDDGTMFR